MAEQYLIQKTTLTNLANNLRHVADSEAQLSFDDMNTIVKNCVHKSKVFNCYVGMMPPNDNVGNDGDVFLLV